MSRPKSAKRKLAAPVPSLCYHPGSDQDYVRLNGRMHYLGKHGNPTNRQRYNALLAEWEANGRQLPVATDEITIRELVAKYTEHCKGWYRKPDGSPTTMMDCVRLALRTIEKLYGPLPAPEFGPTQLRAMRGSMIREGLCRSVINARIWTVKRMFKWASSYELIEANVWSRLLSVESLQRGRSDAKETGKILPVSRPDVDAVLPHLSPVLQAMVELQWKTGMRPGEVCAMRPCDIEKKKDVWVYLIEDHKTAHRGHKRQILLGHNSQRILSDFMDRESDACIFSPAESEAWYRWKRTQNRKTPVGYGNRVGSNRKATPSRRPKTRWLTNAYSKAIKDACYKAGIEPWTANRLRHSAATWMAEKYGLEAASLALGHGSAALTDAVWPPPDPCTSQCERIGLLIDGC